MNNTQIIEKSKFIIELCAQKGLMAATAESCTGGMIAASLTDISGSSAVVDRGFVTYSNEAKNEMLGVDMDLIIQHGAVSREVAGKMAEGALKHSRADITVSVTGVAGPGGGTAEKPVGLVFMGGARNGRETIVQQHNFAGDRAAVREATVMKALELFEKLAT